MSCCVDSRNDPYQTVNLADLPSRRALLTHYRDALQAWLRAQNDTFEACTWYEGAWTEDRNILRGAKGGSHDLDLLADIVREHFPDEAWERRAK